jgi:predicted ATP-binding protein involved in virulence
VYLKKISLENFKCFEKAEIELQKKMTLIVGANGAGKTSLLESIAIAMSTMFTAFDGAKAMNINKESAHLKAYRIGSTDNVQPQYPVRISARAEIDGKQEIYWERTLNTAKGKTTIKDARQLLEIAENYQKRLQKGDTTLVLPVIAYYGTGRLWDYHREKQTDIFEKNTRTNGYIDCMSGTANIKLMMNWFLKMTVQKYQNQENGYGPVPELEAVFSAMEQCYNRITGSNDSKIQYNIGTKEIDVAYTDLYGVRMRIPLNQLSDGYKSTISLVADIAYRMAVLNPQFLGEVCLKTDGIILIDEVDLHLHPAWQKRILKDLTEIFPNVQFVVSTHAPEVINSVLREQVIVLENYQALPAPMETYGKDANGILRAIMRVKERPNDIMEQFDAFYHAIDLHDYMQADEILSNLEELLGDDPELAAMRVQLELEQI